MDGDGWTKCDRGHRHWGRYGAAGLLLSAVDDAGVLRVLMQYRAAWSHHGHTWGLVGGARMSGEDEAGAALREAVEEAGLDRARIRTRHTFVDDHGGWAYTTVYANTPEPLPTEPDRESAALEWVPLQEVADLPLHPGFAATWPQVRPQPAVVLVDAANVVGARPDGWWRDRAGAATRLLAALADLRGAAVPGPYGGTIAVNSVVAVLEGAANAAADQEWVEVVRTPRATGRSGDDCLVAAARRLVAAGSTVVAVSADRGLRRRLDTVAGAGGTPPLVAGPRWLLHLVDQRRSER